jgi:iron complex transport system ATP-binding protein
MDLHGVSAGYPTGGPDSAPVVHAIDLSIRAGEMCVVLGPNGAGKSTLLRVLAGALRPTSGSVQLFGRELGTYDRRQIARAIAVVHQRVEVAFGFTVREVVAMGRAPHQGGWMRPSRDDEEATDRALHACDLGSLAGRSASELSGGEQKRVAIARALAQDAKILLLDEAGAHLDVGHAHAAYELLHLEVARGVACVSVLHDLNLAAAHADRIVLLEGGRIVADGGVKDVMTPETLERAFGSPLTVGDHPGSGVRYVLPPARRAMLETRPLAGRDL